MAVRAQCYGCDMPALPGKYFCSKRCAASYAEGLIDGNEEGYCPTCGEWKSLREGHGNECEHDRATFVKAGSYYEAPPPREPRPERPLTPDPFLEGIMRRYGEKGKP